MTLTLDAILRSAGLDPADTQAICHAFVREPEDIGPPGMHADLTDDKFFTYTQVVGEARIFRDSCTGRCQLIPDRAPVPPNAPSRAARAVVWRAGMVIGDCMACRRGRTPAGALPRNAPGRFRYSHARPRDTAPAIGALTG